MGRTKTYTNVIAVVLIAFALITIFMSSAVLFDWFGLRAKQGFYVPFIVKTNLTAGLLYLIAAYAFIKRQGWAFWVMLSTALLLIYAFALLYVRIHTGGLYESHTVIAMVFRIVFTLVLATVMYVVSNKEN